MIIIIFVLAGNQHAILFLILLLNLTCTNILSYLHFNFFNFQLEQSILNFSEGLRAIGIKPDEKIALFADNSCRWLVADQGMF